MKYKRKELICLVAISIMALLPFAVSAQINTSVTLNNADLNGYSGPITISGGTSSNPVVVTLGEDIILISGVTNYFIIGSDYITFDGNNNTVTINTGTSYPGLIKNGSFDTVNGYSHITIKNIVVSAPSDVLSSNAGWIGQDSFGYNATNISIDNCHSNCPQISTSAGGIVGRYSTAIVTNCSSTGVIGSAGGGICGKFFSGTVANCYSTGAIGTNAGGIIGSFSSGKAINCYSIGNITGGSGGGIMGADAKITATATNCYSTGTITGSSSGGILGIRSVGQAINCYSTGNITGIGGGGIMGGTTAAIAKAINCYSTGNIGSSGGGIMGANSLGTATNCYTIGSLGSNAGGIMGSTSTIAISNCISSPGSIWNDSVASSVLTGTNGEVWVGLGLEQPFTLASFKTGVIATANFGSFTTYSGAPSYTQTMVVSGTLLQSDITISVPVGYEVSTSPSGIFSSSLSLSPIAGTLDSSTLYIRLTNGVVNGAGGYITIASAGCNTQNIATGIAALQSASTNLYGSKTIDSRTRINKNGVIGVSGISINGKITLYPPSLSATSVISSISANTAVSGGVILSNGGSAITATGVCWSLAANPTTADNKTSDGTSLSYTSSLTGLITGTNYYVRAYATNSEGTLYGTGVSFTTL